MGLMQRKNLQPHLWGDGLGIEFPYKSKEKRQEGGFFFGVDGCRENTEKSYGEEIDGWKKILKSQRAREKDGEGKGGSFVRFLRVN